MSTARPTRNQLFAVICLVLALVTLVVYWPITRHGFTNFDDDGYITGNSHVKSGLTWSGLVWAFKNTETANWHPLTWISHMVDCQLYGLNPGGHHLTNLLFHIANTLLLFLLLNELTGALWRSAFVAALFAWHPLHIESVAWAAERKDVLSAFFWMLTLLAYTRYVRGVIGDKCQVTRTDHVSSPVTCLPAEALAKAGHVSPYYCLALFFFACGLMSKPMVVTLPFVLLLLDFWPLARCSSFKFQVSSSEKLSTAPRMPSGLNVQPSTKSAFGLIYEKLPFFALAAAGSVVTYLVQKTGGAVSNDTLSFRVANALWSYLRYIFKTFWPADLAVIYPFPSHWLAGLAMVAATLLVIGSGWFIFLAGRHPCLLVGWFWFLGTLAPVIGLVQIGSQSMADRYMYIPSIGLFILVVWGLNDLFGSWPQKQKIVTLAGTVALAGCLVCTWVQIKYWQDSISLFRHAMEVTTDNYVACACLAQALDAIGQEDEALTLCTNAVRIEPNYPPGQFFLGMVLLKKGKSEEALSHLSAAARLAPFDTTMHYDFGKVLLDFDRPKEAAACFIATLDNNPNFTEARNGLGKAYWKQGKLDQATNQLSQAVTLEPDNPQFHYDFGTVLLANSNVDEAIAQFSEALRLKPDYADAHGNLAVAFIRQGRAREAVLHFSEAVRLQPNDPERRFNLGLALLDNYQPAKAAFQFSEELRLAPDATKAHYRLAQALQQQNKPADAVRHYREALRLTPEFPEAKAALDQILSTNPNLLPQ
jgi:tetratricopeptide (TPR) repeat protein